MDVIITHRHMPPSQSIDEFVRQRIDKMARFAEPLHGVDVILERVSDGRFRVEMTVHTKRHRWAAHAESDEIHAAINALETKMESQLRRHKERIQDAHRKAARAS